MLARDESGRVTEPGLLPLLSALGASAPTKAEEQALRAIARGQASEGQQKIAWAYTMKLGGVSHLMFDSASERVTSFRLGSQAVAQTLAAIAGASWVAFRSEAESTEVE